LNLPLPDSVVRARLARPVSFGAAGQQLAGWYHPAASPDGRSRDCLVVMCNPLGYEAICVHRHYRLLAQQLAHSGFAVLRYDHHGTGDSSGSDADPQRLSAWLRGVGEAIAYGRSCSGALRVCLFGVRMGATLAMAAANGQGLADSIVAWAPLPSGAHFLREMRALRLLRGAEAARSSGSCTPEHGEEAAGYLLTAATAASLETLSLLLPTPPAPAILLLGRDDLPDGGLLSRHLAGLDCELSRSEAAGYAGMMRDTFDAVVPEAAFREIRGWLEGRYPLWPAQGAWPAAVAAPILACSDDGAQVRETPVHFGSGGELFGILAEPAGAQRRNGAGVIFVNAGSNHHTGPHRLYVSQARTLAGLGCVALRMDIGGVGESPAAPGRRDNQLYGQHSVADVQAAVRFLREQPGVQRIVLVGVCSGAYLAFHTAAADAAGIAGLVLINPQTFHWREGDSLQLRTRRSIRALSFYRSRLFRAATWRRLLLGHISTGIIVMGVAAVLGRRASQRLARLFGPAAGAPGAGVDVEQSFRRLLSRRLQVLLLYSGDDGGLNEMEVQLGRNASALRRYRNFELKLMDGADHTFTPLWAQRRLLELLVQYMERLCSPIR
jgi:dienelactone hydrolase